MGIFLLIEYRNFKGDKIDVYKFKDVRSNGK